jgi:hypothetical protein
VDRAGIYEHGLSSAIRIAHLFCAKVLLSDLQQSRAKQRGKDQDSDRGSTGKEVRNNKSVAEQSSYCGRFDLNLFYLT